MVSEGQRQKEMCAPMAIRTKAESSHAAHGLRAREISGRDKDRRAPHKHCTAAQK